MTKIRTFYPSLLLAVLLALTGLALTAVPALAQGPVVNTAFDENDGECVIDCSLRDAIAIANPGETITFAGDTAITLAGPLVINKNLTIDGETYAVTVSGNDAVRVFHVYTDTRVTFDSLTIAHGKTTTPEIGDSPAGGGVKIETGAVVTVTNSAVLSNTAIYDAGWDEYYGHGGGVFNLGTLTVISATFTNNVASSRTGYVDGDGGAIHNRGTLLVTDSTFTGNAAGSGGAIYNRSGATLTVENSTISNNSAPCGGAGISSRGNANVSNSTIADNVAPGDWCEGDAAGIGNTGTMTVTHSIISGNVSEGYYGGLSNYDGTLTVMNSAIYNNVADGAGGGIYNWWDAVLTVTNSSIYSNTAGWGGGGILSGGNVNTKLTLINSTLAHNNAAVNGGGLYNGSSGSSGEVLTMINSTVVSNTSEGAGSGIFNWDSANVTLDNIILWGNSVPADLLCNMSTNRPTISYSNIEGSGGSASWYPLLGSDGGGNLDQDPKLGPPADNGGPLIGSGSGQAMPTYALLSGSPAIDTGDNDLCPATDQRGVPRPQGAGCDIGAYEAGPPEMAVLGNGAVIPDGNAGPDPANHTDFGSVTLGRALTRTFTISNSGLAVLNLTGTPVVSITGPATANFSVVVQPQATVAPNRTTSFQVSFTPSASSTQAVTVTIASDDADENPYNFALQGAGTNQPPLAGAGSDQTVDAGAAVTLNGSGSSDPDGHTPLSYGWTQSGGPAVTFTPTLSVTTFTAPGSSAVLTFTLTVTDSFGLAGPTPDEVVITVDEQKYYLPLIFKN